MCIMSIWADLVSILIRKLIIVWLLVSLGAAGIAIHNPKKLHSALCQRLAKLFML